ncbi:hypothetical protein OSB04_011906 [Centaurea solstitialis]|uniref:Reverse transcriptase Ty1/copia-type domain-containing protein n=1 Tax=Centaurea solstitialis TaxID=347529 RepID=A0AA38TTF8_9ASTR|nr:hypothetical protein OSB04_011906 [Centaurea solstitialis]
MLWLIVTLKFMRLNLANTLADCDSKIVEIELIMQILRQLPPSYHSIVDVITNTKPFPSFQEAKNMLLLHESCEESIELHTDAPITSSAALYSSSQSTQNGRSKNKPNSEINNGHTPPAQSVDVRHPQSSSKMLISSQFGQPPPHSVPVQPPPQPSFSGHASQYGQTQFTDLSSMFQAMLVMMLWFLLDTLANVPIQLNNVLVSDKIIKIHCFTVDNSISVEFDPFGFTVKDFKTGCFLQHCDSDHHDLYPRSSLLSLVCTCAERTIRTINNTLHTSLIQASFPPTFWVEALLSSIHTYNLLPSTTIQYKTLFEPPPTEPLGTSSTPSAPATTSSHPMTTRSCTGSLKPKQIFNLSITSDISPIPWSTAQAMCDPHWRATMDAEMATLLSNHTCDLVPKPSDANIVGNRWLYRHKFDGNGRLERYKGRLVAQGFSQQLDLDFDDIFSPVFKPATIRTVLSISISRSFLSNKTDTSLFTYHRGYDTIYLLLYVNDIILTASSPTLISMVISQLSFEFPMSDLALQLTPKQSLQYLTFTRPDIAYAVQQVCLFMHDPRLPHFNVLKRILRYLKGTLSHGLHIKASGVDRLVAYSDANWTGAEAEYRGIANVVAETAWLRNLLLELSCPLSRATVVFCDNWWRFDDDGDDGDNGDGDGDGAGGGDGDGGGVNEREKK